MRLLPACAKPAPGCAVHWRAGQITLKKAWPVCIEQVRESNTRRRALDAATPGGIALSPAKIRPIQFVDPVLGLSAVPVEDRLCVDACLVERTLL